MEPGEGATRAYSLDLRELVARAFKVSPWTVKRYLARTEAGTLAPSRIPGRTRKIAPGDEAALRAAAPDGRLDDHCDTWAAAHGTRVSRRTMARALRRVGWSRKKRRWSPASATRLPAGPGATT